MIQTRCPDSMARFSLFSMPKEMHRSSSSFVILNLNSHSSYKLYKTPHHNSTGKKCIKVNLVLHSVLHWDYKLVLQLPIILSSR